MSESPSLADTFATTGCSFALINSDDDINDPFNDRFLFLDGDETDSNSSSDIYVGTDSRRHIDTADAADEVYIINSAVSTKVVMLPQPKCEAVAEMKSYLRRSLPRNFQPGDSATIMNICDIPDHDLAAHQSRLWRDVFRAREIQTLSPSKADKLPNFSSDDLLIANIIRAIARELAGHCVFVVRSRSDQPAHFCNHPLCPGARTQPETMWLSIEPFMDWGTLEPTKSGIFGEAILVFKRNAVSGAGGYHLKDFMPVIRMKFCFHCLGDLWDRRHTAGLSPFTSPKRVKDSLQSSRLSNTSSGVTESPLIFPSRKATTRKPRCLRNPSMTENSYGRIQAFLTSLDSEDHIEVLTSSPDKRFMDLDGSSSETEDIVDRYPNNDDDVNEADVNHFSNNTPRAPGSKSWSNPVNSASDLPAYHQSYISPYPLQLNNITNISKDEFPPLPSCKPRVSLRGLGVTRTEIRGAARRAGVMVSDVQREFLEKNGAATPLRASPAMSLQSQYGSPVPLQPPIPSSVRPTPTLRSRSSNVRSSRIPPQSPQKRALNINVEAVDEEEKLCQNSITARILREQETLKIERGLHREAKEKRAERHNEMRRKRRAGFQNESDIEGLEKLYNTRNPKKRDHMANHPAPFQVNPPAQSPQVPNGSQTPDSRVFLSFSQRFPPLRCYCRRPDDGNMTVRCKDLDCPGHRYHSSCLVDREKLCYRAENWTCNLCKYRRATERSREVITMETWTAIHFNTTFSIEEIVTALGCPGQFYGGVRNPYGLGLASGAEPSSPGVGRRVL